MTEESTGRNGRILCEASALGLAVCCLLVVIGKQLALGWDEGHSFRRISRARPWLSAALDPATVDRARLFRPEAVAAHWPFSREEPDGHGPAYALVSMIGLVATERWLPPPLCYRIGSIALFSVAAAAAYATMRRQYGPIAGLTSSLLLATSPRVVPETCFAAVDGTLLSLAMLTWVGFVAGADRRSWHGRALFGVAWGLAMADKLTGWLLLGPYVVWSARRRDRASLATLAVGVPIAFAVLMFVNVGWWSDPATGIQRYFASNLSRRETVPVPILYLGQRYDFSLPWHNTLVWTAIAEPVSALALGWVGIAVAIFRRREDPWATLLFLNWSLLMVVRAMPQAPGHDGVRQLLVSFGFLPMLAGVGLRAIARRAGAKSAPIVAAALAALALGESAWSLARYHPYELSYYSPAVGGLPGAERLGFEPTYFWDSLTPDALDWLGAHTPAGECVMFSNLSASMPYLVAWGRLRAEVCSAPVARPAWYVLQHRPGMYKPIDHWLLRERQPAYRRSLMGVPLLSVYSGADFESALVANRAERSAHER